MSDGSAIFIPAKPYDESKEKGRFSAFDPGIRVLEKGWRYRKPYAPLPVDVVFEKDSAVPMRDGKKIYVDVFRPTGPGPFPVIIAWSPYGKSRGGNRLITALRKRLGINQTKLSGLMKFEAPDPAFWVQHGYAVCNPDARGAFNSEGDIQVFGEQEGRDGHDLVEWLAEQPWCSGKVAFSGNSWLAVCQWFIAAQQPPHLAAIAPREGLSDLYRDTMKHGGVTDTAFADRVAGNLTGKNQREDAVAALKPHPLMGDYWRSKIPQFDNITVPAYVVASYTSTVHTPGTFRAWERIASPQKWLRIHNKMEWPDYYDDANERDLLRFFDHFLKGEDNGWDTTPPVRYSLIDFEGGDVVNRPAPHFPPPEVTNVRFYLDTSSTGLSRELSSQEKHLSYNAQSKSDAVQFTVRFDHTTEIVGYPKVKLWVQADGSDDMDVFVFLQKLDRDGKWLTVQNTDSTSPLIRLVTRVGASVLKYRAVPGRMRVSLRQLHLELSREDRPVQSFDRVEKLRPGQIVDVEIALFPVGLLLHPGEQLRLIIVGHNIVGAAMPGVRDVKPANRGRHIIHTGATYDSYLQLPIANPI